MGIDIHNLNFLAHAADRGVRFNRTLAIGRQAVFVDDDLLERHRALRRLPKLAWPAQPPGLPNYFEPLLTQWFGATVTQSVDASAYEYASFIHDMNLPWPLASPELGRHDAVLDFGCLEHVFNFPVAWRNCVDLCRVGGHLLHSLPANNLAGHGFYQFSPELFFNLYQPANGFDLLDLFFALKADGGHWWRVADPRTLRRRVTLRNSHEVYMLVLARKRDDIGVLAAPQQSDYAEGDWLQPASALQAASIGPAAASIPPLVPAEARRRIADVLTRFGVIEPARRLVATLRAMGGSGLSLPARDYRRVNVEALLRQR